MKYPLFTFMMFVILFPLSIAQGSEIDLQFKDYWISRIHRVMEMNGALQPDETAVRTGANEWSIDVELIELPGTTINIIENQWQDLLEKEQKKLVKTLRGFQPDLVPSGTNEVTEALAEKMSNETDTQVLVQKGVDHKEIRKWILSELLTRAGHENASYFLDGNSRKPYDYFRFHVHDASAEVIGEDLLIIRGVKKVIIVRIKYVHS